MPMVERCVAAAIIRIQLDLAAYSGSGRSSIKSCRAVVDPWLSNMTVGIGRTESRTLYDRNSTAVEEPISRQLLVEHHFPHSDPHRDK